MPGKLRRSLLSRTASRARGFRCRCRHAPHETRTSAPPASTARPTHAHRSQSRTSRRSAVDGRRPHPPCPGDRQPPHQRREIHAAGRVLLRYLPVPPAWEDGGTLIQQAGGIARVRVYLAGALSLVMTRFVRPCTTVVPYDRPGAGNLSGVSQSIDTAVVPNAAVPRARTSSTRSARGGDVQTRANVVVSSPIPRGLDDNDRHAASPYLDIQQASHLRSSTARVRKASDEPDLTAPQVPRSGLRHLLSHRLRHRTTNPVRTGRS
jgi:hypothetical protein